MVWGLSVNERPIVSTFIGIVQHGPLTLELVNPSHCVSMSGISAKLKP
jgi:hypothetical protein